MCDRLTVGCETRPNTIIVKNNKLYLGNKELPPFPKRLDNLNPLVIGDDICISGYELKNGKWKRTLKAFFYNHLKIR